MRTFFPRSMMADMSDIFFAFRCKRDRKGYTMLGECERGWWAVPTLRRARNDGGHVGHFFAFLCKTAKRANTRFAPTKIGKEYTMLGAGVQFEAQPYSRSGELVMIELAEGTTPTTPHPPDRRNLPPLSICVAQH